VSPAFTGTGTLLRFALRRDRIRLPAWIAALWLLTVASVASFAGTYPTAADRAQLAATLDSPAMLAVSGPRGYLADYTYGAMTAHQLLGFVTVFAGLMSALTVVRHTRAEEEKGRAELLRSSVVGRHAQLTAALVLAAAASLLLGVLLWLSLPALGPAGLTFSGSLLYGAGHAAAGLVFAGVAAVAAHSSSGHQRSAT
jgi:ABC-2 type transport system permease protein